MSVECLHVPVIPICTSLPIRLDALLKLHTISCLVLQPHIVLVLVQGQVLPWLYNSLLPQ